MSEELKPCPCGYDPKPMIFPMEHQLRTEKFRVACPNKDCWTGPWAEGSAEAIAAWNRRPFPEAKPGGLTEDQFLNLLAIEVCDGNMFDSERAKVRALVRRLLTPAPNREAELRVIEAAKLVDFGYAASLYRHDRKAEEAKLLIAVAVALDRLAQAEMKGGGAVSQFAIMCQPCENGKHPSCMNPERCECGCRGGCGECSDCDEGIFPCHKPTPPSVPESK